MAAPRGGRDGEGPWTQIALLVVALVGVPVLFILAVIGVPAAIAAVGDVVAGILNAFGVADAASRIGLAAVGLLLVSFGGLALWALVRSIAVGRRLTLSQRLALVGTGIIFMAMGVPMFLVALRAE